MEKIFDIAKDSEKSWGVIAQGIDGNFEEITDGKVFKDYSLPLKSMGFALVGKNKLDVNSDGVLPNHSASSSTGLPSVNANTDLSDFIPVEPGATYCVFALKDEGGKFLSLQSRFYAYDSQKQFISGSFSAATAYTVQDGASYIRVAYNHGFTDYMLLKGTERPESYIPYELLLDVKKAKLSEQENDAHFASTYISEIVLPPKIFAFAGIEMVINIPNIIDYFLGDVYVRATTSNRGKLMSKKWKYTPEQAENFNFQLWVFDHGYNRLNNPSIPVEVVSQAVKESITALVIGDSTVQAGTETQKMLDLAQADSFPLTLLGTRGSAPNLTEGRGGWTASMYVHNASNPSGSVVNAFYNPEKSLFDFAYYMGQQSYQAVDCVFIQLGINDVFSPKTDAELQPIIDNFISDMDIMISSIHSFDLNIKIVLNLTIPCSTDQDATGEKRGVTQTVWRNKHNVYLLNKAVISHYADAENVTLSWYNAAIDCDTQITAGDVHPTEEGYNALGTQMYSVLRAIN